MHLFLIFTKFKIQKKKKNYKEMKLDSLKLLLFVKLNQI
jgi:hypothetical protein